MVWCVFGLVRLWSGAIGVCGVGSGGRLQAAALGDTGRPSLGSSASPAKGRTLAGILGYEERPLVSTDYTNESRSGVVDAGSTMVTDGTLVKLYVWYDNEWGYSCRMEELVRRVVAEMQKGHAARGSEN